MIIRYFHLMISFSVSDYLLIGLYFAGVLYIGFRTKQSDNSALEYLVAGRTLTLPAFVATLVATFYGGVLGVGEFTFNFGISSWFLYAFPYYVFILIFAFFLAGKIRKSELYTIPEKLERIYGRKVGIAGAVLIFFLVTPAPYVFMLGIITQLIFGIPMIYATIISLLISIVYLFRGGLRADVRVNVLEFVLMFAGFGLLVFFCFSEFGGFEYLTGKLDAEHLSLTGGNSLQFIMVWFFIGAWALVDPSFHQRCYAAKSESVAKKGVLASLVFWIIFDFLTTVSGLYAKAYFGSLENPTMSYPLFANEILPPLAKGFFFIGMIAAIMSTLHSFLFVSATTLGNDIISKARGTIDKDNRFSKLGIIVSAVVSLGIVFLLPTVVGMWYAIGSIIIPALLISVLSSYTKGFRAGSGFILTAMIFSFTVSLLWLIYGELNKVEGYASYPLELEPMYPGLFAGIIVYAIGLIMSRNEDKNLNSANI